MVADVGVGEDRTIGETEQHQQTKGPKYRVAPGGSRPVGGPVRQEAKQFVVLEFRSEPRVVPSHRIRAKTPKEFRSPEITRQKQDKALQRRFRPADAAWAREREALVQV